MEHTHVAVALCIASGVADVGVGIEAAALQFGLCFIPLVEESYFLACLRSNIKHPAVERLRAVLAGARLERSARYLAVDQPALAVGTKSDVLP